MKKTSQNLGKLETAPVVGVDLYATKNYSSSTVVADGRRTLAYIKTVLKANAVGIVWNFYTTSDTADEVHATSSTLSVNDIKLLTEIAQQDGLAVEYRPLIFVHVPATCSHSKPGIALVCNRWGGHITPSDPASWFTSYYQTELPYLRIAQSLDVKEFVTATELYGLNDSPLWASFFARVARIYHGIVSYAAWDKSYFNPQAPLLPAHDLGMDMYMALHLPASATQNQVTAAWENYFSEISPAVLRRTAIDETAVAARAGAYNTPEWTGLSGKLDEKIQSHWFIAACQTVRRYHLRGVFFWKVDLTDNPAYPATSLSTFEGRAGATAISGCASILGS
jgi:hypothetical protein